MTTRRWLMLFAMVVACNDPVHDARVDALGPEIDGVPRGPLHRRGQPCLTCHGGSGPANTELSVAGTVFATPEVGAPPLAGVTVSIYEATEERDGGAPRK